MTASGTPFWFEDVEAPSFPAVSEDMEVDVAIVGGGIVGLSCAWLLRDSGLRVAVVEARRVGRQATGRSTAKVTSQHGLKYAPLIRKFGQDRARAYAQANQKAVSDIAGICEFLPGKGDVEPRPAYVFATNDQEAKRLEEETRAAQSLGLPAELVREARLPLTTTALLRFSGQYQFNPYLYLTGLAQAIASNVPIFENSRVESVEYATPSRLTVNGRTLRATYVVIATHMPVAGDGLYFTRAFPFAHPVAAAPLPDGVAIDGMFISAGTPTRSLRTARKGGQTFLVFVGGDYQTGEPEGEKKAVEAMLRFLDGNFAIRAPTHLWTNEDFRSMDGVGFVGPAGASQPNLLVATGFDAWGITQGMVAAEIMAARIEGREHPAACVYDSTRFKPVAGGAAFAAGNVAAAGHLVADRVLKRKTVPLGSIQPGEGAVVSHHGEQLAVSRAADGTVRAFSAVCTHLGCIVGWNQVDRTWDCPCHGSRFDETGSVLAGPATSPLEPRSLRGDAAE